MHTKAFNPDKLLLSELDSLLDEGWFRMGKSVFTTHFLLFNNLFYSALWLRVPLATYNGGISFKKLTLRNRKLQIHVGPLQLDEEREALYLKYRNELPFEPSESLSKLLDQSGGVVFQSMEVTLRDDGKLIGLGIFDLGLQAAAGIISVYDPEYKKYSLGRYLIYLKLQWCRSTGLEWFYPGYFAPGYKMFDYKLAIGRNQLEYFELESRKWLPLATWQESSIPIVVMKARLEILNAHIHAQNVECKIWKYLYFDANLYPELRELTLFDYPIFLATTQYHPQGLLVVFNIVEQQYQVFKNTPGFVPGIENADPDIFTLFLYLDSEPLFSTPDALLMAEIYCKYFRSITE